ncbi:MAG: HAMP domain-containing histidine kinase [Atopobiaceae bacterium]|nr:HAMP domain-containing histidine kinase [Atopobiaceae bacterium]
MIKQLRRKFIVIALASVAIVLLVIVGGINISNYISVISQEDARADLVAAADGELDEFDWGFGEDPGEKRGPGGPADFQGQALDPRGFDRGLGRETPFDTRYFIVWVDADEDDEAVLASSADLSHIVSIDAAEALDLGERAWRSNRERGTLGGYRFLRCEIDGEEAIVFVDMSREMTSFSSFAMASAVASVAGLLAVAAILVPVSAIVVRPIEESQERQRRFVTDASHELKTPLAIISSSADVIEIENGESEWVESIRHQVARLSDLTSKLVALTKAEEGTATMKVADYNLTALVEEVAREFEPVAVANGKRLVTRVASALTARGDKALVRQAITLLLDNALKHSDDGGEVRLEADARRGHARISVWNTVEEIAPGDHPEFFERFYRADEARSSSGGHGIGLAVVSAIAEAHNGSVSAHSEDGRSLEISLNL